MKRATAILAVFYLLSVTGYGLKLHYCLGQITDVNIAWLDTSCCCDEGAAHAQKPPCCDEKEFFVQLDDEHQTPTSLNGLDMPLPLLATLDRNTLLNTGVKVQKAAYPENTVPPFTVPLFKQHCSLVYYG